MPYAVYAPNGLAENPIATFPKSKVQAPVLSGTYGHGVVSGTTASELNTALANGAKRILFGRYSNDLGSMMPPATNQDVLVLVAESHFFHGQQMAEKLAQAIHHRAHLTPEARPKLQLVLFELLTNAIEHGNLGFTTQRKQPTNQDDWFIGYNTLVRETLGSPLGRIPLLLSCRCVGGDLEITIEDRGMGFSIRQTQEQALQIDAPHGHGLGLVFAMLENRVEFSNGGRRVTFKMPVRPREEAGMLPTRSHVRDQARIFLVDTQQSSLNTLETTFRNAGFRHIQSCVCGIKALEKAQMFKPDLIFLDVVMPGIDGYTLCQKFKADPILRDVQVVFLTATDKPQERLKGYRMGAVDYMTKPLSPEELIARTDIHLTNALAMKRLRQFSARMETDLERARLFQHDLLPSASTLATIADNHNLSIASIYQGCDTLAGDYWSVMEIDSTHIAMCLVDFTGHGVIAALNTVQLHTLLANQPQLTNPVAVALTLNRQLHKLLGNGSFATFIYGVLDTETGDFSYAGGGTPPVLVRQKEGQLLRLDCAGLPLGLAPDIEVLPRRTKLAAGDTLIAVSDAMTDAPHANGTRWGVDGLEKALGRLAAHLPTDTLVNRLLEQFYDTVQLPVTDDLTLLAITYKAQKKA